jgi:ribosomal protein L37AE/L43A
MSDYKSVADERAAEERMKKDCPMCNGENTVLEPRSSDKWHCSQCARKFDYDELGWQ